MACAGFWRGILLLGLIGIGSLGAQPRVIPVATGEWPPLVSQQLPDQGPFTTVIREAFRRMGTEVSVRFVPWRRAEALLAAGEIWACYPYTPTSDRQAQFLFSDEISVTESRFFVHRGGKLPDGFRWTTFGDLKPFLVGGVRGYWYESAFSSAGVSVDYAATDDENFAKLASGRVDLILLNGMVGWNTLHRLFPDREREFAVLPGAVHPTSLRLMVSKTFPGAQGILPRFNHALATMVADGTVARLLPR